MAALVSIGLLLLMLQATLYVVSDKIRAGKLYDKDGKESTP